ncbi:hypothetical protein FGB62_190g05 [Gracilaria domingensis]|nr:hypothetical protein FGB62_190g05 [Gracilaria domingensis]
MLKEPRTTRRECNNEELRARKRRLSAQNRPHADAGRLKAQELARSGRLRGTAGSLGGPEAQDGRKRKTHKDAGLPGVQKTGRPKAQDARKWRSLTYDGGRKERKEGGAVCEFELSGPKCVCFGVAYIF